MLYREVVKKDIRDVTTMGGKAVKPAVVSDVEISHIFFHDQALHRFQEPGQNPLVRFPMTYEKAAFHASHLLSPKVRSEIANSFTHW